MKITQYWRRNHPSTMIGESVTLTTVYSSFDKSEIDELEKKLPQGFSETGYEDGKDPEES